MRIARGFPGGDNGETSTLSGRWKTIPPGVLRQKIDANEAPLSRFILEAFFRLRSVGSVIPESRD